MSRFLTERLAALGHAWRGIADLVRHHPHGRVHALATLAVLLLALWLEVSSTDWALLLLACALVWTAEAFNTALEYLADRVSTEHHPLTGKAKDMAAGAVLLASLGALGVGVAVLAPYL